MTDMSRMSTLFNMSEDDNWLAKLLLDQQNRAIGAGGYAIVRSREMPEEAIDISFQYLDASPSPTHHVFIRDGQIWATHMSGWLMDLFRRKGLIFTTSQVETPPFIASYMGEKIAEDRRRAAA